MILKGMFRWRMHFQTFINNKRMQNLIILETTILFRSNNRTIFKEP